MNDMHTSRPPSRAAAALRQAPCEDERKGLLVSILARWALPPPQRRSCCDVHRERRDGSA